MLTLSLQVKISKDEFDRLRRELRKIQNERAMAANKNRDSYEIVTYHQNLIVFQELEDRMNREEQVLRDNNRELDKAKSVGLAMEDMASDIKFNLHQQTDKMQNKILKNLYNIQGDTTIANRLMNLIKKERMKNKIIMYAIMIFMAIAVIFVIYNLIF